ncbi:MAG: hypothetical protein AAFX08_07995 [Pseudomonadota bacterium]
MLLRRVMEHVRTQNWFAVFLDFVIVVGGVFIGIQVSNWNDARANKGVVVRHLTEIAEDIESHLAFHNELYLSATARIAAAEYLLEAAGYGAMPETLTVSTTAVPAPETPEIPEESLKNVLGWLNLVRVTVSARSGYDSLISSGNLGLIENRDLAREIQLYYGGYDDLLDTQKIFQQTRDEGVRLGYDYGLSVWDERPIEEVVAVVRDHEDYAAYVRTVREWALAHALFLRDLQEESESLLAAINAELEGADDPPSRHRTRPRPELDGRCA